MKILSTVIASLVLAAVAASTSACDTFATCTASACEVAIVSPAIVITDVRVAILPRLGGCRLFSGIRERRAIRIDRRAVRRAVRGRRLFRGRLLGGGCCG